MRIFNKDGLSDAQDFSGSVITVGHFNVIHQGHIRLADNAYDIAAKENAKFGIVLVDDLFADKDGFRPVEVRADDCLACLCDFVVIANQDEFESVLELTKPRLILQGLSRFTIISNFLASHQVLIERFNSRVHFCSTSKPIKVIKENVDLMSPIAEFRETCGELGVDFEGLSDSLDGLTRMKALVLGDAILDEYLFCEFSAMSGEAPLPVYRAGGTETFLGGAGVVVKHLASLGCQVTFCSSLLGVDLSHALKCLGSVDVIDTGHMPVVVKRRYISQERKIFRVNFSAGDPGFPTSNKLAGVIETVDLCKMYDEANPHFSIITDFGSGFFSNQIDALVRHISSKQPDRVYFDAQITPGRNGFEILGDTGLMFPTEEEARATANMPDESMDSVAEYFLERSPIEKIIITCGSEGVLGFARCPISGVITRISLPALNLNPLDLTGAGDAFLTGFAISDAHGNSFSESLVLGSIFSAVHTSFMGNGPLQRNLVDKYIGYLSNA